MHILHINQPFLQTPLTIKNIQTAVLYFWDAEF